MGKILQPDGKPYEPERSNSLLSTQFLQRYAEELIERELKWDRWRKVMELRRSAGLKSETTVQVHKPPRYVTRHERDPDANHRTP